ncbi:Protein of unknown function DUF2800 [uncultured Caudovirales phage]|uniref:Uncharacterized protein n=1 Tax=uncultured Caudovirales phage TaxID=2100421 RepID=A0A6J5KLI4_9CAUD|nr:Protein of unknown function DUF2800 [uncultured Caudovirales phage]
MSDNLAHSNWGGSVCKRYRSCPGSVAACAAVPKLPSSAAADEGTLAHAFAERFLVDQVRNCAEFVGFTLETGGKPLSTEMARAVQFYLDAVWAEFDAEDDSVYLVEQKFVLPVASAPEGAVFGRNDALVYSRKRRKLTVFDYKNGFQPVEAEDNDQGKFYGAGAALSELASDWPVSEVEIVIVQPNARDVDNAGAVRRWAWNPVDLLEFVAELEVDIAATLQPDAARVPGEHCRWCDAAPFCEVRVQTALQAAALAFTDVALLGTKDLPDVQKVDVDRLVKLKHVCDVFSDWGKKIEDRMLGMLEQGQSVPGFKLVEKMARRKWQAAGDDIAGYMATVYGLDVHEVLPPTLVTITEAEKLLALRIADKTALKAAKDDVSLRFTIKESSGTTLAPESDRREAINRNPAQAFAGAALSN